MYERTQSYRQDECVCMHLCKAFLGFRGCTTVIIRLLGIQAPSSIPFPHSKKKCLALCKRIGSRSLGINLRVCQFGREGKLRAANSSRCVTKWLKLVKEDFPCIRRRELGWPKGLNSSLSPSLLSSLLPLSLSPSHSFIHPSFILAFRSS